MDIDVPWHGQQEVKRKDFEFSVVYRDGFCYGTHLMFEKF